MKPTAHVLPITLVIVALGFVCGALVLGGVIAPGRNPIWPQASQTGGQLAIAFVIAGVVLGGVVGAIGQFVQVSRKRQRSGRATGRDRRSPGLH